MGKFAFYDQIWAYMPVILTLSRTSTLDKAADQLGVNRTTIARRLKSFENAIGGRLFTSVGGEYVMTPLGEEILRAAEAAEQHFARIEAAAPPKAAAHAGPIQITMAPHLAAAAAPVFLKLARSMPQCQITVSSSYNLDEIEVRKAEIALRVLRTKPEYPLIGTKLKTLRGAIYKSRQHQSDSKVVIERLGEAKTLAALRPWRADAATVKIDDIIGKRELIAAGGIGRLPIFMGDTDDRLERASKLLPDAGWHLWLITHQSLSESRRITAARNEIEKHFKKLKTI